MNISVITIDSKQFNYALPDLVFFLIVLVEKMGFVVQAALMLNMLNENDSKLSIFNIRNHPEKREEDVY